MKTNKQLREKMKEYLGRLWRKKNTPKVDDTIFPHEVSRLWLAGVRGKWKYRISYFVRKKYQKYCVGQVVHLLTINKRRGFYKIINIERPGMWSDRALWDDGKKYDFEFMYSKRKYVKQT